MEGVQEVVGLAPTAPQAADEANRQARKEETSAQTEQPAGVVEGKGEYVDRTA